MPVSRKHVKSELCECLSSEYRKISSLRLQDGLYPGIDTRKVSLRKERRAKNSPQYVARNLRLFGYLGLTQEMSFINYKKLKSTSSMVPLQQKSSLSYFTGSNPPLSQTYKFRPSFLQKTHMISFFSKVNDNDKNLEASNDNIRNSINEPKNDDANHNLDTHDTDSISFDEFDQFDEYDDEGEYYEPEDDEIEAIGRGTISLRNSQSTLDLDLKLIYRQMQFLLQKIGKDDHDVSLWLTNNEIIQDYNQQYRGMDKATDILSFPFHTYLSPEVVDPNSGFPISQVNNGDDMDDVDLDDDLDEMDESEWDIDYDEHGNPIDKSNIEYDDDEKEMMRLLNKSLKKQEMESKLLVETEENIEIKDHEEIKRNEDEIIMEYEDDDGLVEANEEQEIENLSIDDLQKQFDQDVEWTRIPPGYIMKDLGDMIISVDYVLAQCKDDVLNACNSDERGASGAMAKCQTVQERIPYLLIHGLLHLQGYDHETEEDYELMVKKEEELINKLEKEFKI